MPLFRCKTRPTTGNPTDDDALARLGARVDLTVPRHWTHDLHVADEATARRAAEEVLSDGWDLDRVEPEPDGSGWVVVVKQDDVVLSPERVAAARRFFESLADRVAGGDYRGWTTAH